MVQIVGPLTEWASVVVERQGERLDPYVQVVAGQTRILADWPRSGPGNYRIQVRWGARADPPYIFAIQPAKITEAAFQQLVIDLEAQLPAAVALALQSVGGLTGLTLLPPSSSTRAQELQRLRRAILGDGTKPGLAKILIWIAQDPYSLLRSTEPWVVTERARRPIASRLFQATSRGHNLSESGIPLTVIDRHVELSYDVYENRLIHSFHNAVARRLARLIRTFRVEQRPTLDSDAAGARTPLQQAIELQIALRRARARAEFLDEVGQLEQPPDRLTMVLLNRASYHSALEAYHAFVKSVWVKLADTGLEAPLENLPHLYEVWGTLQIVAALLESAAGLGYRVVGEQRLIAKDAEGVYVRVLPNGKPILTLAHSGTGVSVRLIPQFPFATGGALNSISFAQIPDVTVEVRQSGRAPALYLFDPKYKLDSLQGDDGDGRPKKDDIDKMHAYRDAIRGPDGEHVVRYAATLYPGPLMTYRARQNGAPEIEALHADPALPGPLHVKLRALFDDALS